METKHHVTLKDANLPQPLLGEFAQVRSRPPEEYRIDRIHLEDIVFPLDQSIKRGAGGLGQVKKDDGIEGSSGFAHCAGG